jgi:hypothetical protein
VDKDGGLAKILIEIVLPTGGDFQSFIAFISDSRLTQGCCGPAVSLPILSPSSDGPFGVATGYQTAGQPPRSAVRRSAEGTRPIQNSEVRGTFLEVRHIDIRTVSDAEAV